MLINNLDYDKIYKIMAIIRPDYQESDVDNLIASVKLYKNIFFILADEEGYVLFDRDYVVIESKFKDVESKIERKYPNLCHITLNLSKYGVLDAVYDIKGDFYIVWDKSKGEIPFEFMYDEETGDLFYKMKI